MEIDTKLLSWFLVSRTGIIQERDMPLEIFIRYCLHEYHQYRNNYIMKSEFDTIIDSIGN